MWLNRLAPKCYHTVGKAKIKAFFSMYAKLNCDKNFT